MDVKDVRNQLEDTRQSTTQSLAYASLSDDGVAEVAKFVRDNPFVKYLDLRGNNMQGQGAKALANGIKANRSMRSLNLKWNCIGKDWNGLSAICEALKGNLTITQVDLRNNHIDSAGAEYVAEVVKGNTTITHFDLSWNNFGVEGGTMLLEALKRNEAIVDFQLCGSKVGEDILSEVAFYLRRNRAAAKRRKQEEEEKVGKDTGGDLAAHDIKPRTREDDRSLMLRLLMREREEKDPDEKLFFQQIGEHIQRLLKEADEHKLGRAGGEERERLSTSSFLEREERYLREVKESEESIIECLEHNKTLKNDIARQVDELKHYNTDSADALRATIQAQQHLMAEEQQVRKELRDITYDKKDLQQKYALYNHDCELLENENHRLAEHVECFNRNKDEVLAD